MTYFKATLNCGCSPKASPLFSTKISEVECPAGDKYNDMFRAYNDIRAVRQNTPNVNMADHSVGARDESNESEASQALMFCFDNAFPEKSCFVVDLVPLFRPPYAFLCS